MVSPPVVGGVRAAPSPGVGELAAGAASPARGPVLGTAVSPTCCWAVAATPMSVAPPVADEVPESVGAGTAPLGGALVVPASAGVDGGGALEVGAGPSGTGAMGTVSASEAVVEAVDFASA